MDNRTDKEIQSENRAMDSEKLKRNIMWLLTKRKETLEDLVEVLGISYVSVSKKINGHVEFKHSEIVKMCNHFNFTPDQFYYVFYESIFKPKGGKVVDAFKELSEIERL